MVASAETQAATLQKFLDGWKQWNPAGIDTFPDDFTQVTMPFNMGVPVRTRREVEQILPQLMHVVHTYELSIHDVLHDARRNKAVVYAVSKGESRFGPWNMEYACFLTFNEAGTHVSKMEEMLDSASVQMFSPNFAQYLKEQQGQHQ